MYTSPKRKLTIWSDVIDYVNDFSTWTKLEVNRSERPKYAAVKDISIAKE